MRSVAGGSHNFLFITRLFGLTKRLPTSRLSTAYRSMRNCIHRPNEALENGYPKTSCLRCTTYIKVSGRFLYISGPTRRWSNSTAKLRPISYGKCSHLKGLGDCGHCRHSCNSPFDCSYGKSNKTARGW